MSEAGSSRLILLSDWSILGQKSYFEIRLVPYRIIGSMMGLAVEITIETIETVITGGAFWMRIWRKVLASSEIPVKLWIDLSLF